jgi:hypothetical protein
MLDKTEIRIHIRVEGSWFRVVENLHRNVDIRHVMMGERRK